MNASSWNRRIPWAVGLGSVAVIAVLYPLIREQAQSPLSLFVIPPLLTAIVGRVRTTLVVGVAALAVAATEGAVGGLDGAALWVRLGLLIIGTGLAAFASSARARKDLELRRVDVREALQRSLQSGLVPVPVPPEGLLAEARYVPGVKELLLGGDFLDVVALPDGGAGFIIGDVCGHGPRAAAFGTAIRAGWKSLAYAHPTDPNGWLELVERAYFHDGRFDGFVTALAGRLCPTTGDLQMVSAGHCWPIRLLPEPTLMKLTPGPPLGIGHEGPRPMNRSTLVDGSQLLLYTDGLTENRSAPDGPAFEVGVLEGLGPLMDGKRLDLDDVLERFGPSGFDDDVALLHLVLA